MRSEDQDQTPRRTLSEKEIDAAAIMISKMQELDNGGPLSAENEARVRRLLRGEITRAQAVEEVIAKHRA